MDGLWFWLFLTVLWIGLQCVIVVYPDYALTFSKRNLIKGHLLKSNVRSDICFAIMHALHGLY